MKMKTVGEDTAGWEKMQSHYKDEKMSREGKTHQEGSLLLTSVVLFRSPPSLSLRRHNASWHLKVYPELNPTISDIAKGQLSFTHTPVNEGKKVEDVTCVIILVIGFLSLLWKEGVKLCVCVTFWLVWWCYYNLTPLCVCWCVSVCWG